MYKLLIILLATISLHAQTIFPGIYGEELKSMLVEDYKPVVVFSYGTARDSMYARIDNNNGSLTCVYSGYTIAVPYGAANPRDYTNGASPIMNAEHTWPRSKGASENSSAFSDMHHLFATNGDVNAARGSYPFAEIDDDLTDRWYLNTSFFTAIPSSDIDLYSELDLNTSFEVPESHKGNVARAMFYFYTMYKSQADAADPNFFNIQKDVLRQWNMLDPVDEAEITRTNYIAKFQEGKANPFVLDTTLIGRSYFGVTTGLENEIASPVKSFSLKQNYPNPFNPETTISYQLAKASKITLTLFDVLGKKITVLVNGYQNTGTHSIPFNASALPGGIYFYSLTTNQGTITRKMILLP